MPSSDGRRRKAGGRTYHHGDLRQALLEAALTQIESVGAAGISLRRIAKAVGVSHMAPYNHFKDKSALLAAAAAEGFRQMRSAMETRMAEFAPGDPRHFQAAGVAYAAFAVARPELFRLMFGPELADKSSHRELADAATDVERTLHGGMRAAGIGTDAGGDSLLALAPWALVHGLAMLAVAGQLPRGAGGDIEGLTRDLTYLLFVGLSHWPPAGGPAPADGRPKAAGSGSAPRGSKGRRRRRA